MKGQIPIFIPIREKNRTSKEEIEHNKMFHKGARIAFIGMTIAMIGLGSIFIDLFLHTIISAFAIPIGLTGGVILIMIGMMKMLESY